MNYSGSESFSSRSGGCGINRRDDQGGRVFATIFKTGTEVGVEFFAKAAASKGVDQSCSVNIIEGDPTPLVVHPHPHPLRLGRQRQADDGAGASSVAVLLPQTDGPVAVLRTRLQLALPADGLPGDS